MAKHVNGQPYLSDFESMMWEDDSRLCCRLRRPRVVVDCAKPAGMLHIIIHRLAYASG